MGRLNSVVETMATGIPSSDLSRGHDHTIGSGPQLKIALLFILMSGMEELRRQRCVVGALILIFWVSACTSSK